MGFISAGSWSLTYSGIMVSVGVFLMMLSIFLLSRSSGSSETPDVSQVAGKKRKNSNFTKDINRFFKNIMR